MNQLKILIKGAGEMATGIACRLHRANMHRIVMAEIEKPLAVRRAVSFCETVYAGRFTVEDITAARVSSKEEIEAEWKQNCIGVIVDPAWEIMSLIPFDVVIDATIAKRNLGTRQSDAPLVIGMGPGFSAGSDVHIVIETNRGHDLGRLIKTGEAEPNTGIPGNIGGYTAERVLRAPCEGVFATEKSIGDLVEAGNPVGTIGSETVPAGLDGVIRGLIRPGTPVHKGLKIGDIDPRGNREYCHTISDKARSLGGAVMEAIMGKYNSPA